MFAVPCAAARYEGTTHHLIDNNRAVVAHREIWPKRITSAIAESPEVDPVRCLSSKPISLTEPRSLLARADEIIE